MLLCYSEFISTPGKLINKAAVGIESTTFGMLAQRSYTNLARWTDWFEFISSIPRVASSIPAVVRHIFQLVR